MTFRLGLILAAIVSVGMLVSGRSAPAAACPSGPRAPMIVHRGAGLRPPRQSAPAPLVIGLHASQSNPWGLEHISGLDGMADNNGFVVAYLSSQTPTASAWALCNMSSNLAYISTAITKLTRSQNIDPSRVYITGFSAGATMSFRAGCALSRQVAAIAPVSGWMMKGQACRLSRPESMMLFIGTKDAININGTSRLMSGTGMGAFWAHLDGCSSLSKSPPGAVTHYGWNGCNDTSAVAVDVIAGGSHNWPPAGSGADRSVAATQAMWAFFFTHPAASPMAPSVNLTAAGISRLGRRWVRVALSANETPLALKAVLIGNGRRIVQRTFHLSRGRHVASLAVPKAARPGRYTLKLAFSDRYGRRSMVTRSVDIRSM